MSSKGFGKYMYRWITFVADVVPSEKVGLEIFAGDHGLKI